MNEGEKQTKKRRHNISPNSIASYHEMKQSGFDIKQADNVFWLIAIHQPVTARQIEELSGCRPSSVTARVNKLVADGRIKAAKNVQSAYSGKTVTCYALPEWQDVVN